VAALDGLMRPA